MSADIIDGKAAAVALRERVGACAATLAREHGFTPGLAVVLVGDHAPSRIYVRNKIKATEAAGMRSIEHRLDVETTQGALLERVAKLNADPEVHGILVQLPLPEHIDPAAVVDAIDPAKDVDGLHVVNAGRLLTGAGKPLVPCTPLGCMMLLSAQLGDLSGLNAVVVGRSNLVGKPMLLLLMAANCTVTVAHSRTRSLPELCRNADILVAATGVPHMIRGDWIKPKATVIDVGINRIATNDGKYRIVGDVDFDEAVNAAGAITPVPGGVGPMTIAVLLRNTVVAACRQAGLPDPDL